MNPAQETENYSAAKKNNPRVCIAHSFQRLQPKIISLKRACWQHSCVSGIKVTNDTTANMSVHSGMCNSLY